MRLAVVTLLIGAWCAQGCFAFSEDGGAGPEDAGTTFDPAVCMAQLDEANQIDTRLSDVYASPCTADSDCAIDPGSVDCPDGGASLDTAEIVYSIHREDEYHAARAAEYADFCIPGCGGFHIDNFYYYAFCRDGVCQGTHHRPDEYCPGGVRRIAHASTGLDGLGVETHCIDVSDCELVETDIDCEGSENRFLGCPIAVREGQEEALLTVLHDGMLSNYCSDTGFTCDEVADCPVVELACLEGVCAAVEVVTP